MEFSVGLYRDDEGNTQWAVFSKTSRAWYFPEAPTEEAAKELADDLNRDAT